jgi:hypothetical protein
VEFVTKACGIGTGISICSIQIIHRGDAEIAEKVRMRMKLQMILRERFAAQVAHVILHFELFSASFASLRWLLNFPGDPVKMGESGVWAGIISAVGCA